MKTLTLSGIIKQLALKTIPFFSLNELGGILAINNRQTLYKRIQRLIKNKIFHQLIKGKYYFTLKEVNDFTLANFLYQPSYISLQSALSFHGLMTGFPYQITSITAKKPKQLQIGEKDFNYSKIAAGLFWGWENQENFLMVKGEKVVLDYVYFAAEGLVNLDWEEIDLTGLDKKILLQWAKLYGPVIYREIKSHL